MNPITPWKTFCGAPAGVKRTRLKKMRSKLWITFSAAMFVMGSSIPLLAHHAFGGEFDPNRPILLKGKIVRVEWVNPHSWIHMEVTKPDGTKEVWMIEGGSPNSLLRRGVTKESLQVGIEIVVENGNLTRERWNADPNAPIDCFYVYPTVSTDLTPNSDMVADPAELNVIRQQFARFASKCRPYAPMYRQVTLAGLRILLGRGNAGVALSRGLAYDDIRDAWKHYLENDNKGRGFVLIGHSQGSLVLSELIRNEIDGKPVQSRMVSAILLGTTLSVPRGKDTGGSFQHVRPCRSESQTGCVITYASFRSTVTPPPNTLFGRVSDPDMAAVCTNPAALRGWSGNLNPYFSTEGRTITGTTTIKPWVSSGSIDTPWVKIGRAHV